MANLRHHHRCHLMTFFPLGLSLPSHCTPSTFWPGWRAHMWWSSYRRGWSWPSTTTKWNGWNAFPICKNSQSIESLLSLPLRSHDCSFLRCNPQGNMPVCDGDGVGSCSGTTVDRKWQVEVFRSDAVRPLCTYVLRTYSIYVRCVCMHACIMQVNRQVCRYVRMHVCMHACMHVCMYVRTYVCTHVM